MPPVFSGSGFDDEDDYSFSVTNTTIAPSLTEENKHHIPDGVVVFLVSLAITCLIASYVINRVVKGNREDLGCDCGCFYINCCFPKTNKNKKNLYTIEHKYQYFTNVLAEPEDTIEACTVCLEPIAEGSELAKLNCGHKSFHKKCLNDWFVRCQNKTCPLCRFQIDNK
jgi:hypothetical protein